MNEYNLIVRTLTPLWTGDVDRDSPTLRETGLVGSLRWWYEGLHRGLGNDICEPVEGQGCQYDAEKGTQSVCPACQLFGCTGWARRFRLSASDAKPLPLFFVSNSRMVNLTGNWLIRVFDGRKDTRTDPQGRRQPTFSFDNLSLWSEGLTLSFIPLHADTARNDSALLAYVLHLLCTYGGLGAKTQNGFGQVKILRWEGGWSPDTIEQGRQLIWAMSGGAPLGGDTFNLSRFFSHTYELASIRPYDQESRLIGQLPSSLRYAEHFIPCAFDIRYKSSSKNPFTGQGKNFGMRPFFRDRFGSRATSRLLGESRPRSDDDRAASRINVSHLYRDEGRWKLKVWGHIPANLKDEKGQQIKVDAVERAVDEFIAGTGGMFPGSRVVQRFDSRKELGR